MINKQSAKAYCKDDISMIENYENAINDKTQTWVCHHRRETIFSRKDLIEIGEYYNRPAAELIFLTNSDHNRLHKLGKHHSAESRKKMSEAKKGDKNPRFGKPAWNNSKHHSEESRKKMSEKKNGENNPFFGKHHSEEAKKKMSESHIGKHYPKLSEAKTGKHWYNNGVKSIQAKTCPEGFVPGRLK